MNNMDNFEKNLLTKKINVTGLYTIHYFRYGRNFKYPGEEHGFWELVYIDSGSANVIADSNVLTLQQGHAFIHKPFEHHNIYTEEKFANSAIITFECKNKILNNIAGKVIEFDEYEKGLLNKIIHEGKAGFNEKLDELYLKKMTKKMSAPFANEQFIKNCIELLLISLIRKSDSDSINTPPLTLNLPSNRIVDNINVLLEESINKGEKINLNNISYKLGFSKSHIKTQFKKKTGISIIQHYINLKIDKAKKLLSQQKYTISEISDMLGFSSVFYFSRLFKKATDMSPTEYINSIKADNVL